MLELMYASGLRVSELVALKAVHVSLVDSALRVTGKGARSACCRSARRRAPGSMRYLAEARRARSSAGRRATPCSSPRAATA